MNKPSSSTLNLVVKPHENFDQSAKSLFKLIVEAQRKSPNEERHIHLEIEGHLNEEGGFDHDMFELQTHFTGFIMPYIKSISTPLGHMENPKSQINDLPFTDLMIQQAV